MIPPRQSRRRHATPRPALLLLILLLDAATASVRLVHDFEDQPGAAVAVRGAGRASCTKRGLSGACRAAGVRGHGVRLPANSTGIACALAPVDAAARGLTFAAWVAADTTADDAASDIREELLFSAGALRVGYTRTGGGGVRSDGLRSVVVRSADSAFVCEHRFGASAATAEATKQWRSIVVSVDAGGVRIFVDAALQKACGHQRRAGGGARTSAGVFFSEGGGRFDRYTLLDGAWSAAVDGVLLADTPVTRHADVLGVLRDTTRPDGDGRDDDDDGGGAAHLLTGHWRFDAPLGRTAYDVSGNGAHAVAGAAGAPDGALVTTGPAALLGGSAVLSNATSWDVALPARLLPASDGRSFTVAAWYRHPDRGAPASAGAETKTTLFTVASNATDEGAAVFALSLRHRGLASVLHVGGVRTCEGGRLATPGWHHVSARVSPRAVELGVDGATVAACAFDPHNNPLLAAAEAGGRTAVIGAATSAGGDGVAEEGGTAGALLDDLRFYAARVANSVLLAAQAEAAPRYRGADVAADGRFLDVAFDRNRPRYDGRYDGADAPAVGIDASGNGMHAYPQPGAADAVLAAGPGEGSQAALFRAAGGRLEASPGRRGLWDALRAAEAVTVSATLRAVDSRAAMPVVTLAHQESRTFVFALLLGPRGRSVVASSVPRFSAEAAEAPFHCAANVTGVAAEATLAGRWATVAAVFRAGSTEVYVDGVRRAVCATVAPATAAAAAAYQVGTLAAAASAPSAFGVASLVPAAEQTFAVGGAAGGTNCSEWRGAWCGEGFDGAVAAASPYASAEYAAAARGGAFSLLGRVSRVSVHLRDTAAAAAAVEEDAAGRLLSPPQPLQAAATSADLVFASAFDTADYSRLVRNEGGRRLPAAVLVGGVAEARVRGGVLRLEGKGGLALGSSSTLGDLFDTALTFAAWLRPDAGEAATRGLRSQSSATQALLGMAASDGFSLVFTPVDASDPGSSRVHVAEYVFATAANESCAVTLPHRPFVFQHVAFAYGEDVYPPHDRRVAAYHDGVLKAECRLTGAAGRGGVLGARWGRLGVSLMVGAVDDLRRVGGATPVPAQGFRGWLDDVRLYRTALQAAEIRALASAGRAAVAGPPPQLSGAGAGGAGAAPVVWYAFDEGDMEAGGVAEAEDGGRPSLLRDFGVLRAHAALRIEGSNATERFLMAGSSASPAAGSGLAPPPLAGGSDGGYLELYPNAGAGGAAAHFAVPLDLRRMLAGGATLSARVRLDASLGHGVAPDNATSSDGDSGGDMYLFDASPALTVSVTPRRSVVCRVADSAVVVESAALLPVGGWAHVACAWGAAAPQASSVTIFIDGVASHPAAAVAPLTLAWPARAPGVVVGRRRGTCNDAVRGAACGGFRGAVDDIVVAGSGGGVDAAAAAAGYAAEEAAAAAAANETARLPSPFGSGSGYAAAPDAHAMGGAVDAVACGYPYMFVVAAPPGLPAQRALYVATASAAAAGARAARPSPARVREPAPAAPRGYQLPRLGAGASLAVSGATLAVAAEPGEVSVYRRDAPAAAWYLSQRLPLPSQQSVGADGDGQLWGTGVNGTAMLAAEAEAARAAMGEGDGAPGPVGYFGGADVPVGDVGRLGVNLGGLRLVSELRVGSAVCHPRGDCWLQAFRVGFSNSTASSAADANVTGHREGGVLKRFVLPVSAAPPFRAAFVFNPPVAAQHVVLHGFEGVGASARVAVDVVTEAAAGGGGGLPPLVAATPRHLYAVERRAAARGLLCAADGVFTASSLLRGDPACRTALARLHSNGSWCAGRGDRVGGAAGEEWLELDMLATRRVHSVSTAGRPGRYRDHVSRYLLLARNRSAEAWSRVGVYDGGVATRWHAVSPPPLHARHLRFVPLAYSVWPSMQVGVRVACASRRGGRLTVWARARGGWRGGGALVPDAVAVAAKGPTAAAVTARGTVAVWRHGRYVGEEEGAAAGDAVPLVAVSDDGVVVAVLSGGATLRLYTVRGSGASLVHAATLDAAAAQQEGAFGGGGGGGGEGACTAVSVTSATGARKAGVHTILLTCPPAAHVYAFARGAATLVQTGRYALATDAAGGAGGSGALSSPSPPLSPTLADASFGALCGAGGGHVVLHGPPVAARAEDAQVGSGGSGAGPRGWRGVVSLAAGGGGGIVAVEEVGENEQVWVGDGMETQCVLSRVGGVGAACDVGALYRAGLLATVGDGGPAQVHRVGRSGVTSVEALDTHHVVTADDGAAQVPFVASTFGDDGADGVFASSVPVRVHPAASTAAAAAGHGCFAGHREGSSSVELFSYTPGGVGGGGGGDPWTSHGSIRDVGVGGWAGVWNDTAPVAGNATAEAVGACRTDGVVSGPAVLTEDAAVLASAGVSFSAWVRLPSGNLSGAERFVHCVGRSQALSTISFRPVAAEAGTAEAGLHRLRYRVQSSAGVGEEVATTEAFDLAAAGWLHVAVAHSPDASGGGGTGRIYVGGALAAEGAVQLPDSVRYACHEGSEAAATPSGYAGFDVREVHLWNGVVAGSAVRGLRDGVLAAPEAAGDLLASDGCAAAARSGFAAAVAVRSCEEVYIGTPDRLRGAVVGFSRSSSSDDARQWVAARTLEAPAGAERFGRAAAMMRLGGAEYVVVLQGGASAGVVSYTIRSFSAHVYAAGIEASPQALSSAAFECHDDDGGDGVAMRAEGASLAVLCPLHIAAAAPAVLLFELVRDGVGAPVLRRMWTKDSGLRSGGAGASSSSSSSSDTHDASGHLPRLEREDVAFDAPRSFNGTTGGSLLNLRHPQALTIVARYALSDRTSASATPYLFSGTGAWCRLEATHVSCRVGERDRGGPWCTVPHALPLTGTPPLTLLLRYRWDASAGEGTVEVRVGDEQRACGGQGVWASDVQLGEGLVGSVGPLRIMAGDASAGRAALVYEAVARYPEGVAAAAAYAAPALMLYRGTRCDGESVRLPFTRSEDACEGCWDACGKEWRDGSSLAAVGSVRVVGAAASAAAGLYAAAAVRFEGCFADSDAAGGLAAAATAAVVNVDQCGTICAGHRTFGLKGNGTCYCGNAYVAAGQSERAVPDAECGNACWGETSGAATLLCGTDTRVAVYSLEGGCVGKWGALPEKAAAMFVTTEDGCTPVRHSVCDPPPPPPHPLKSEG